MQAFEIIFWVSIFAVFYAYIGYTGLLWLFSLFYKKHVEKGEIRPSVSIVISAYNEEKIIARKIENTLDLDYPENLLEIAIISDGSTDGTNKIIKEYAKKDDRIKACIEPINRGKTEGLNRYIPLLRGEIIIFSDANSFYEKGLIKKIIRPFLDKRIGYVTGSTVYVSTSGDENREALGIYSKIERYTKALESNIGSCIGSDGAVFAIRKSLFFPMKPSALNDLVIPLRILREGFRGILEENVFCKEQMTEGSISELKRQVRITTRTLRAIYDHRILLNPFAYPLISFEIISHKIMKFVTPFLLILILISNAMLFINNGIFYKVTLIIQLVLYSLVLLGSKKDGRIRNTRFITILHTFVFANIAYMIGWFSFLMGKSYTIWTPAR